MSTEVDLYGHEGAASAAAAFAALHPGLVHYAARYYSETLYTLLLALLTLVLTRALRSDSQARAVAPGAGVLAAPAPWRRWALGGVCFGLATITRSILILLPVPLAFLLVRRLGPRRARAALAAFLAGAAPAILPWSVVASTLSGSLIATSTWTAVPIYQGQYVARHVTSGRPLADLDGEAKALLARAAGPANHLTPSAQVRRERTVMREVAREIAAAPVATLVAWLRASVLVWVLARTPWTIAMYALLHLPLLVLAAIGLTRCRPTADVGPLLAVVVYSASMPILTYPQARYVLPIAPLLAIPAAAAAALLVRRGESTAPSSRRAA